MSVLMMILLVFACVLFGVLAVFKIGCSLIEIAFSLIGTVLGVFGSIVAALFGGLFALISVVGVLLIALIVLPVLVLALVLVGAVGLLPLLLPIAVLAGLVWLLVAAFRERPAVPAVQLPVPRTQ